nr:copia protein [Tanacetum cinerariifolium]
MWLLDYLSISVPSKGRYKTKPPSSNVIKSCIQVPRQGQATRIKNKKTVFIDKNEILTHKIQPHMKPWVDIIRENAICLGGHKDHVSACVCHMIYCIETSTRYNLAFSILKRIEKTRNKPKELLPYGMLLTRLFKHVVKRRPRESNASSSSTTLKHPSSSRSLDDTIDENDDESFHSNSSSPSQNISSSSLHHLILSLELDIMFSVYLCARFQEAPKTSHLEAVKRIFRYIKDYVDRKSTSGICTFVGCCLTSWFPKKQTALAVSTIEAEYISVGKACQQALWMKQALIDYDVRLDDIPIMCDNKGAIDLSKNPVQHSRTKHIEIRHHFLRNNVQKGHISIEKVSSVDNIVDILTKPLKYESFNYLRLSLGMMEHIP